MKIFSLSAYIACSIVSQLFLKSAGLYAAAQTSLMHKYILNPWLCASLGCFGLSFLCWMYTLRRMPLSVAYPWTALIYALTPLICVLVWGERVSPAYIPGIACIIGGVVLTSRSSRTE
ncbi:MAG TPA: hypothetical protein DEB25_08990 [Desulfobulbaceae bacterium]|nr:hypothetical protein [Desulfobulbaceae bacterium]